MKKVQKKQEDRSHFTGYFKELRGDLFVGTGGTRTPDPGLDLTILGKQPHFYLW